MAAVTEVWFCSLPTDPLNFNFRRCKSDPWPQSMESAPANCLQNLWFLILESVKVIHWRSQSCLTLLIVYRSPDFPFLFKKCLKWLMAAVSEVWPYLWSTFLQVFVLDSLNVSHGHSQWSLTLLLAYRSYDKYRFWKCLSDPWPQSLVSVLANRLQILWFFFMESVRVTHGRSQWSLTLLTGYRSSDFSLL